MTKRRKQKNENMKKGQTTRLICEYNRFITCETLWINIKRGVYTISLWTIKKVWKVYISFLK